MTSEDRARELIPSHLSGVPGIYELVARAVEEMRTRAAKIARVQERRWTCSKMKSVCEAIGTAIERDEE